MPKNPPAHLARDNSLPCLVAATTSVVGALSRLRKAFNTVFQLLAMQVAPNQLAYRESLRYCRLELMASLSPRVHELLSAEVDRVSAAPWELYTKLWRLFVRESGSKSSAEQRLVNQAYSRLEAAVYGSADPYTERNVCGSWPNRSQKS
jgi:hypothetical protein